jgi:hypothetical protein
MSDDSSHRTVSVTMSFTVLYSFVRLLFLPVSIYVFSCCSLHSGLDLLLLDTFISECGTVTVSDLYFRL